MGHHLQRPGSCVPQDLPAAVLRQQRAACGLLLAPHCPTYLRHCRCRPCSVQIPFPTLQCPKRGAAHVTPSLSLPQGQAARNPPKTNPSRGGNLHSPEKPQRTTPALQRGPAFIYFSRREAARGVRVSVRTIGKTTLWRSCQETVGHLPMRRAVFPLLLY